MTILGAAGGQFFGGLLVTRYKMSLRGILKLNVVAVLLSSLPMFLFLIQCQNESLYAIIVGLILVFKFFIASGLLECLLSSFLIIFKN